MSFTLEYNSTTVVLPSPEKDNVKRYSSQAIKRWLKGGLPKIVKDPLWPVTETYQWRFHNVTAALKEDFKNLHEASKGLVIQVTDHLGVGLTGIITSPTIEYLTIKDLCSYDFEFEFLATNISFGTNACLTDLVTVVTPAPGDSNYHATLENNPFAMTNQTGTETLTDESGQQLYLEP